MFKNWTKITLVVTAACVLVGSQVFAGAGTLSVDVPKTAYIDWIATAATDMASVDGGEAFTIDPYVGGAITQMTQPAAKDCYIGVMCNSLAGYDLTLNAGAGSTATTGKLTLAGATDIVFTGAFAKEAASFTAGTTATPSLDLTAATKSGTTVHTAEADLPLLDTDPNVWKLTITLPAIATVADDLIQSGTYTGSVTSTIALK